MRNDCNTVTEAARQPPTCSFSVLQPSSAVTANRNAHLRQKRGNRGGHGRRRPRALAEGAGRAGARHARSRHYEGQKSGPPLSLPSRPRQSNVGADFPSRSRLSISSRRRTSAASTTGSITGSRLRRRLRVETTEQTTARSRGLTVAPPAPPCVCARTHACALRFRSR